MLIKSKAFLAEDLSLCPLCLSLVLLTIPIALQGAEFQAYTVSGFGVPNLSITSHPPASCLLKDLCLNVCRPCSSELLPERLRASFQLPASEVALKQRSFLNEY